MSLNAVPDPKPEPAASLEEALNWFARLRDGRARPEIRQAFAAWHAERPEHAEAYAQVTELWQSPVLNEALAHYAALPLPAARRRPWRPWAAAASLLLAMGWGLHAGGLLDRWRADYATGTGEQSQIVLADGSRVTLNTDTALVSEFDGERRSVRILHGEAYFEVRPDSTRPFVVAAASATVRVVGTRFTVRTGRETQVAVESGIVDCAAGSGAALRLTVGQQAAVSVRGVERWRGVGLGPAFAWVKGRLIFQDRPLTEVIAELDRYHPGIIYLTDSKLGATRITGSYKLGDTGAVIRSLADVAGAQVVHLSPYLTVLKL